MPAPGFKAWAAAVAGRALIRSREAAVLTQSIDRGLLAGKTYDRDTAELLGRAWANTPTAKVIAAGIANEAGADAQKRAKLKKNDRQHLPTLLN